MILISNNQRDDIVRIIGQLCSRLKGEDTRTVDLKRRAGNLAKKLDGKRPFELPAEWKRFINDINRKQTDDNV